MPEIADLLLIQQKLRLCTTKTRLGHLLVNDTTRITPFDTGVLWLAGSSTIEAVSGLPEPINNTPFTDWMSGQCQKFAGMSERNPLKLDLATLGREDQERWREYLAGEAVWVPLTTADSVVGGLLLCRKNDWMDEELGILGYWSLACGHAVDALWNKQDRVEPWWEKLANRRSIAIAAAVVFAIMWIPVDLSVNASAEVVPRHPDVVRSPIEGIIGEVLVSPNQAVAAGELVLTFDDTAIRAQLDVVRQELAIANAEYQRANQAAVADRRVAAQLPMLKARVEQRNAQVRYNESVLDRSRIYAEEDSIAVVPESQKLEGKPVQVGEKIFTLARPSQVELEFWLAVGDSIPLPAEAEVEVFLNVHPEKVYPAIVRYVSYQAEVSPEGILGFRGRADFPETEDLRVGWRGTAKVIGEPVFLGYYIFRRPLAAVRQWSGL